MRIAIVQFPGSNCERETALAVKRAGMEPVEFLWNQDLEDLRRFEGYVLVGGFSYEDRSRSGIIAALDPLLQVIREESEKGKPVLGICNGAQILVESGLVPGLAEYKLGAALTDNKRLRQGKVQGTGYYNAWVHMRLNDKHQAGAFTRGLSPRKILRVPIAHGEGRFVMPSALLQEMQAQGMNLFQYCTESGEVLDEFPVNPNGSMANLAAITNKAGNVMAMMPHPERTPDCDVIFSSMREYIAEGKYKPFAPLSYQPEDYVIKDFDSKAHELIVELIITDNHAMSVNHELKRAQIPARLQRQIHWEIECEGGDAFEEIIKSDLLYNKRKEFALTRVASSKAPAFLVRAKEDWVGQRKKQILEDHFGLRGVKAVRHGVLWRVQSRENMDLVTHQLIHSHILFNPYAHDCYYYS